MINKNDLQKLVDIRVNEASVLFENQCYIGAYYLLGYAVECALKAIIAKKVRRYDFPDKELANQSYSHNLSALIKVAGLEQALKNRENDNDEFKNNWAITKDWTEKTRYQHVVAPGLIKTFFSAILDEKTGILTWLKSLW